MPPPTTSSDSGRSSSSAPVESMIRGSSGRPGNRSDSEPAAMMHWSKLTVRVASPLADLQLVRGDERRLAADHRDLALPRERLESAGEACDDAVLPVAELRRIDLGRTEAHAELGHRLRILDHAGRMQQRLGRDAADVQAHAAQRRPALDQRDRKAQVRGAKRRRVTARAGAEHDEVEIVGMSRRCGRGRPRRCGPARALRRRRGSRRLVARHRLDRDRIEIRFAAVRLGRAQRPVGCRFVGRSRRAPPASR